MKALLVADNELVIEHVSTVLKTAGYDMIIYRALLKALDNIEEIAPHLIVISTKDYPRHWKTLAQYSTVPLGSYVPQVILYTDGPFDAEEQKKADALHIRGHFSSIDVDGLDALRKILSEKDDIFSGALTEKSEIKPVEIPDDFAEAHAHDEKILEEFVEEEVSHPGESLEKIGQQIENEVTRAASPQEMAAVTDEEIEESDDRLEEIDEVTAAEAVDEAAKPETSFSISIDDILKQNQSFNRFAEIPDIKTEEEAKSGESAVYEFNDVKGRREDAGDIGKSPMDLWAEIEAEEGGATFDDEPAPEMHFNPIIVDDESAEEPPLSVSEEELLSARKKAAEEADAEARTYTPMEPVLSDNLAPIDPSLAITEADLQKARDTASVSISLSELLAAQKLAENDKVKRTEMENTVKEKIQKVAENAANIALDPENPVTVTQQEVDNILDQNQRTNPNLEWLASENADEPEPIADLADTDEPVGMSASEADNAMSDILRQNQFSMKNQIDWLAKENADEPEPIDAEELDDFSDPTGTAAQEVAESLTAILEQNQKTDTQLDWLSEENADEPEHPNSEPLDDLADPTGETAHEVAASVMDILQQNQIMDSQLAWLSDENADEPEAPIDADFDDNTEPTGMSASERDAHIQDIVTQNQTSTQNLDDDIDKLQSMVEKLNILRSIVCTFVFTNPETGALISGSARNYTRNQLEFTPDIPELAKNFRDGTVIDNASLKTEDGIEAVSATVISTAEPLIIAINHHGK